jgi:hypothetical protein
MIYQVHFRKERQVDLEIKNDFFRLDKLYNVSILKVISIFLESPTPGTYELPSDFD